MQGIDGIRSLKTAYRSPTRKLAKHITANKNLALAYA